MKDTELYDDVEYTVDTLEQIIDSLDDSDYEDSDWGDDDICYDVDECYTDEDEESKCDCDNDDIFEEVYDKPCPVDVVTNTDVVLVDSGDVDSEYIEKLEAVVNTRTPLDDMDDDVHKIDIKANILEPHNDDTPVSDSLVLSNKKVVKASKVNLKKFDTLRKGNINKPFEGKKAKVKTSLTSDFELDDSNDFDNMLESLHKKYEKKPDFDLDKSVEKLAKKYAKGDEDKFNKLVKKLSKAFKKICSKHKDKSLFCHRVTNKKGVVSGTRNFTSNDEFPIVSILDNDLLSYDTFLENLKERYSKSEYKELTDDEKQKMYQSELENYYEDIINETKEKLDEINYGLSLYKLSIKSGYYEGIQILIKETPSDAYYWLTDEEFHDLDGYETEKINNFLKDLVENYGWKIYNPY